jgi:transcription initiation protein SPT3
MSQQEYMEYSECRQASFTYKKARKFREWLTGGTSRPGTLALATMAGGSGRELARLSDESLEILGFLAYELVQRVTEVGLAVKCEMDTHTSLREKNSTSNSINSAASASAGAAAASNTDSKRLRTGMSGLFETGQSIATIEARTQVNTRHPALLPVHIEEAYRRLQVNHTTHSALLKGGLNRKRRLLL